MEDTTSGADPALLVKLRALARRGATLARDGGGAGLVLPEQGEPRARMTPAELLLAIDRGWLKQCGAEQFVMSKRGASMLRTALNRSAAIAATRVVESARQPARLGPRTPPDVDGAPAHRRPEINADESPLAWLHRRRDKDGRPLISQIEFDAGERLRADFDTAQMTPRVTASWDMTTPGARSQRGSPAAALTVSEAAVAARQRVERAMKAVGPTVSGVLIDVCCLLQGLEQAERNGGWPRRAGKVVLQIALDQLARHYNMVPPSDELRRRSPRHWGAAGYRPTARGQPVGEQDDRGDDDHDPQAG